MSGVWSPLLAAATVGVTRAPLGAVDVPTPIAEALAALESLPAAERLLKTAAVLDVCLQAGLTFPPAPALIAPAADETRAALPTAAADVLRVMLEDAPPRLIAQALATTDRAGYRLPPGLLTLAPEQRRSRPALAPLLDAVLGERGRWLLATRGEAAPVASVDPVERWQTGTLAERRAALVELLAADRDDGRERFRTALPQMPAAERAELLTVLVDTVTPEDEPLFESLLKDRGREVRLLAAAGLQRLPASGWAARMRARVQALVRRDGKQLLLEPPAEADASWSADGIEVKRPKHESLGERAWWLYELARRVPLSVWQAATGLDAAGLLGWAKSGDWKDALRRAWTESLAVSPEPDGLIAFGMAGMRPWQNAPLFERIPPAEAERFWLAMLASRKPPLGDLLAASEAALPLDASLSMPLAEAALGVYRAGLQAERREIWHLAHLGLQLSILLPLSLLPALRALPRLDTLDAPSVMRDLERNLNLRQRFAAALAAG